MPVSILRGNVRVAPQHRRREIVEPRGHQGRVGVTNFANIHLVVEGIRIVQAKSQNKPPFPAISAIVHYLRLRSDA